ncbi:ATP-binding cassette domain-containing protein [Sporolactobacillus sp. THM19-2]|uniref:ATP-binding cassette domain-containing protein n=1 Tax=Sporolactobacillus sp. THM19-2 TaxID=2511171 RepID=UPI00101F8E95|nr:ABC transporter ATP-binding protein [Sporolactobacillus sp. THM19-2]RYL87312.1 ABC transporter ATP-binding protein [Sporolactobacillus sp. THM19-2]
MIDLIHVNKTLKGKKVLQDINYHFEEAKIYGLFGINGSGKTILLRTIAGLMIPTSGKVLINQKQLHKDISFPPSAGIIIETMQLLPQFDAKTNLSILAKIKKIATDEDIHAALKRVGLDPDSNLKVRKFSLGMKQRLNIAQTIFEKPQLLILDEPTNAVDEKGVKKIHQILAEERERGATVIVATHHKEDFLSLCDETLKMENGVLTRD